MNIAPDRRCVRDALDGIFDHAPSAAAEIPLPSPAPEGRRISAGFAAGVLVVGGAWALTAVGGDAGVSEPAASPSSGEVPADRRADDAHTTDAAADQPVDAVVVPTTRAEGEVPAATVLRGDEVPILDLAQEDLPTWVPPVADLSCATVTSVQHLDSVLDGLDRCIDLAAESLVEIVVLEDAPTLTVLEYGQSEPCVRFAPLVAELTQRFDAQSPVLVYLAGLEEYPPAMVSMSGVVVERACADFGLSVAEHSGSAVIAEMTTPCADAHSVPANSSDVGFGCGVVADGLDVVDGAGGADVPAATAVVASG